MSEHASPSVATPSRAARAEHAASRGRSVALEAAAVGVLGPSAVRQLQRRHGNQRTIQLLRRGPRVIVQRRYRLIDRSPPGSGRVWVDAAGAEYALVDKKTTPAGIELTFQALVGGAKATFTVPATAQGLELKDIKADAGLLYVKSLDPSQQQVITDLNVFTGHAASDTARTDVPVLPASDVQSQFHGTDFVARVSLAPIRQSDGASDAAFTATQLYVADVKMSNDRPPTKFGSGGQRSHTVAWSLLRQSVLGMGQQSLDQFLGMLADLCGHMDAPKSDDAARAAKALAAQLKTGLDTARTADRKSALFGWQRLTSELLTLYVHVYQLSEAATYADAQAVGHGEATSMSILAAAEAKLRGSVDLTDQELALTKDAAVGMLDFKMHLTAKVIAQVIHHWVNSLYLAFPTLMAKHGTAITTHLAKRFTPDQVNELSKVLGIDPGLPAKSIKDKPANALHVTPARAPTSTALPREAQSTFTADVSVIPSRSVVRKPLKTKVDSEFVEETTTITVGSYTLADLKIEAVRVADDRPNTRFGAKQRSHTVPWTLIRRHLIAFGGKGAATLLGFLRDELQRLASDLDKPGQNPYIVFDAPAAAAALVGAAKDLEQEAVGFPISAWQTSLSELVEGYITLYQLSRSATYGKEERPPSHGESAAIAALTRHNAALALDKPDRAAYAKTNEADICANAVKLVDAAVATKSLGPTAWQNAIAHWQKLLKDLFPNIVAIPELAAAIMARFNPAEPAKEVLSAYKPTVSMRDKLLINLYENAQQDLKSVPDTFKKTMQASVEEELNAFDPPDTETWTAAYKTLWGATLWERPARGWYTRLAAYMVRPPRGRSAELRDVPKATALQDMVNDVTSYIGAAKADKDTLVAGWAAQLVKALKDDPKMGPLVAAKLVAIKAALGRAVDEAVSDSAVAELNNHLAWFKVIAALKPGDAVNWATLTTVITSK